MKFIMNKSKRFTKILVNAKRNLDFFNNHWLAESVINPQKFAKTLIRLHSLQKLSLLIRDFKNPSPVNQL